MPSCSADQSALLRFGLSLVLAPDGVRVALDAEAGVEVDALDVDALFENHLGGEHGIEAAGHERDRAPRVPTAGTMAEAEDETGTGIGIGPTSGGDNGSPKRKCGTAGEPAIKTGSCGPVFPVSGGPVCTSWWFGISRIAPDDSEIRQGCPACSPSGLAGVR